jgi:transposase InsO family protein
LKLFTRQRAIPKQKGKVERCIRTFNEEFLRLGRVFENVEALLEEFVRWYNFDRWHLGIQNTPATLYYSTSNVTDVG